MPRSIDEGPVTLRVERIAASGEGVAPWQDRFVGLPGTAVGDEVEATLFWKDRAVLGRVERIVKPGPGRREAPCPLAGRCGGCDWLHLQPLVQLETKHELVLSALERSAGIARSTLRVRSPWPPRGPGLRLRRRAALHVGSAGLFFFAKGSRVPVTVETCPALVAVLSDRLPALSSCFRGGGGARIAEVLLLAEGGACAAALVIPGRVVPGHIKLAENIQRAGFQGVVLAPQKGAPVRIGTPELRADAPLAPGVPLWLRPDAFVQAHPDANAVLAEAVVDLLAPHHEERVLELFGGNGTFTFALAERAQEVWMVEGAPVSLGLARRAADEGQVKNLRLIQGEVGAVAKGLVKGGERFGALIADPPRTGFRGLGTMARSLGVERVVYVACDVAALARDARELADAGYVPSELGVFDLFPQTRHVEAVMAFRRAALPAQ